MNDLGQTVAEALEKTASTNDRLKSIFTKYFEAESKEQADNAGHMAYALAAVDVAMKLANIVIAIRDPKSNRTYSAVCDLTYGLSTNIFWQRNNAVLTPLLHSMLNSHRDMVELLTIRSTRDNGQQYDALIAAGRAAVLDIFPVMAYFVGGPELMQRVSLPMKFDLLPILGR